MNSISLRKCASNRANTSIPQPPHFCQSNLPHFFIKTKKNFSSSHFRARTRKLNRRKLWKLLTIVSWASQQQVHPTESTSVIVIMVMSKKHLNYFFLPSKILLFLWEFFLFLFSIKTKKYFKIFTIIKEKNIQKTY